MNVRDRIPLALQNESLAIVAKLSTEVLEPYETQRLTKSGEVLNVRITATALRNKSGQLYAVATTERMESPS